MSIGFLVEEETPMIWRGPMVISALTQMLAAESLGYHSVWLAEHHFNDYGLCPAPPVLASFVAARTTTLRLGMGVSLLPLHHPDLQPIQAGRLRPQADCRRSPIIGPLRPPERPCLIARGDK